MKARPVPTIFFRPVGSDRWANRSHPTLGVAGDFYRNNFLSRGLRKGKFRRVEPLASVSGMDNKSETTN